MAKRFGLLFILFSLVFSVQAFAQMSDDQIIEVISTGVAAGRTEQEIGKELLAKGVSASQLQRLLRAYRSGAATAVATQKAGTAVDQERQEGRKAVEVQKAQEQADEKKAAPDVAAEKKDKEKDLLYDASGKKRIYGKEIFASKKLSFEPNQNQATPLDYVLGPGDELIIDIYGRNEVTLRRTISPEGTITVTQVGPVALSGLTVQEAKGKLKTTLAKTYSSLRSGESQLVVSLGNARTIMVTVLGEVSAPGTYRLSSFATVFNALYQAGGITDIGSLRHVSVRRAGKTVADVDIYQYIFSGSLDNNLSLREGDVVYVPTYDALVGIDGFVKRPMFYEMKSGEPVGALIGYAGGFSEGGWPKEIQVERKDEKMNRIFTVKEADFGRFAMQDGDIAYAGGTELPLFENRVAVEGAVFRPGQFQLGGEIATVKQLVLHAGGLRPDAFLGRAQLVREKEDRSLELLSIPLGGIMSGLAEDIILRKNDRLIIADVNAIDPKGDFTITGEVAFPGQYPYAEHTSVEDLILLAGGFTEGASSARIDVSRRIEDASSTAASETLAQVFTLSVSDGLLDEGAARFELKPNDIVSVRKSPVYQEQHNVTISGEVTFPGQYTLASTKERVSQLLERAGGATPNGNVRGAILKRKISRYERNVREELSRLAAQTVSSKDSLDQDKLQLEDVYTVGLELDKALAHPGSDYDMVLRDGDELIVPEMSTTVRIHGEVLYPNTVQFISGKPVSYYVNQAGGFTTRARRAKTYVVYMNGTVAVGSGARLEPGCEIVVPSRAERNKLSTGEWLAIGTSAASLTTMVATIVNLIKK